MRWWQSVLARVGVRTAIGRDALLAALVIGLGLTNLVLFLDVAGTAGVIDDPRTGRLTVAVALVLLEGAPLIARRRTPTLAFTLTALAIPIWYLQPEPLTNIGLGQAIAAYSLGAYRSRRIALTAGGLTIGLLALLVLLASPPGYDRAQPELSISPLEAFASLGLLAVVLPGLLGAYVQTRRAYTAELVDRAERLAREREERARRAVIDERTRIARELHDEAAHHLSGIVVQAGAAERIVEEDPDAAREALRFIRTQGKDTLDSMRQLIGVLRIDRDADGRRPQPTLARLPSLLDEARAAGADVTWTPDGQPRPLPLTVDLAAYRTIQEGINNARRHAPGAPIHVRLHYLDGQVDVEVINAAPPDVGDAPAGIGLPGDRVDGGYGLVGLRERAELAGGRLQAGPTDDGGWQLRASLPTPDRSDEPTVPPPDGLTS